MSAKFIYTLSDENPDLQRQIGCINGIFQLFDRRHSLGGGRRIIGRNHKRPPPGQDSKGGIELKGALEKPTGKNHKTLKEKQRTSTESSRTSFSSSSCSSSISSIECSRASQPESSSFSQTTVPETHARDSVKYQPNGSLRPRRQSLDLQDVVKDSIYREGHGISVKTAIKREARGQTLKHVDSPRPFQHPNTLDSKSSGMRESFRVLHKLQEASCQSSKGENGSLISALKDARRFSCDERESRERLKSTIKLKELPRLSLDSRAGTTRSSRTEMKSNTLLGDSARGNRNSNNFLNQQQEPGSSKRASSFVAKLMGLEALPDPMSTNGRQTLRIKAQPDEQKDYLRLSCTIDENKNNQFSGSPRNPYKEPVLQRLKNADSVKKPSASSKFPIEPAPWRQSDGSRGSQSTTPKSWVTLTKPSNSSLSVYGEIETMLAQLEFKKSGKDLRALKQILEAMQKTKEITERRNEVSNHVPQTSSDTLLDKDSKLASLQHLQGNTNIAATGTFSPKSVKSPIVIMKPAKLIGKASDLASSVNPTDGLSGLHRIRTAALEGHRKELLGKRTPRINHYSNPSSQTLHSTDKNTGTRSKRVTQNLKEPQSTGRGSTILGKNSGTTDLRQPQNKSGVGTNSQPRTPLSESNRSRRQPCRQLSEAGSARRKPRPRSPNLQSSDDDLSDISSELRDLSHQGDAISLQSESNISWASQFDDEISSSGRSEKINKAPFQQAPYRQKNPLAKTKNRSIAEPAISSSEQPSPVSVLDAFDNDDLPSPIKKISINSKEDATPNYNEVEWIPVDENHTSTTTKPNLNHVINHKNAENIHFSVKNLKKMLSAHEETVSDDIAHFYCSTNPDHQYISQILSASSIQKDFESNFKAFHLHPTSCPINPNLFLALEQAKASYRPVNQDHSGTKVIHSETQAKIRRKLVFDVVNESLVNQFLFENPYKQWLSPKILAGKREKGQRILGELCSEVDRLQSNNSRSSLDDEEDDSRSILWTDLMRQSMHWTACQDEIPGIVIGVERMIFKDLISEVVTGEAIGRHRQSAGHCRQLFSK